MFAQRFINQTIFSLIFFLFPALLLLTEILQTSGQDGEHLHPSDLRPQHGGAAGQFGRGNRGHRLVAEREQHAGCRGQEDALSSQVRDRVTSTDAA